MAEVLEAIARKVEEEKARGVNLESPFAEITEDDIDNLFSD